MSGYAATPQMNPREDRNGVARPTWLLPTPPRTDEYERQTADVGAFELRRTTLRLMRGENLSYADAETFLGSLLNPAASDAQVAAALAALAGKGAAVEEPAGLAQAVRIR